MAGTFSFRSPRRFGIEHLESRINLSAGITGSELDDSLAQVTATTLVSEPDSTPQLISVDVGDSSQFAVGDTTISGVTTVPLNDYSAINQARVVTEGGRLIVGYVADTGSWIEYRVYAAASGTYSIATEFATPYSQTVIGVAVNGSSVGSYTASNTASWNKYAAKTIDVTLNQGWNTLRLSSTGKGYNIGGIVITPPAANTQTVGSDTNIDLSKHSDKTDSIVTGSAGNYTLEYVAANSYIEFTINVQTAGTYSLSADFATPKANSVIDIQIDGVVKGTFNFTSTGDWTTYANKSVTLNLAAGVHTLRFQSINSTYNMKNVVLKTGEAIPANTQTVGSNTGIDLSKYTSKTDSIVTGSAGSYTLEYVAANSYIEFTVNVQTAGTYSLSADFATPKANSVIDIQIDGVVKGTFNFTSTGAWTTYANKSVTLNLTAGVHTLRFQSINSTYNMKNVVLKAGEAIPANTQTVSSNTGIDLSKYTNKTDSVVTGSAGNYTLEYVAANSYIEFTINVQTAGTYSLSADFATPKANSVIDIQIDGVVKGTFNFTSTGAWTTYANKSVTLNLTAGVHTLRFQSINSTYNMKNVVLKSAASSPASTPVTVATQNMTSFNALNITGTSGADVITLTQSGNTLTLVANGYTTTYSASAYGNIIIKGGNGNDVITVDSSVTVITLVYGNGGNDTLINKAAKGTIVSIGDGTDIVIGNGVNTSIWVDGNDVASGTGSDYMHKVTSFYNGVSLDLSGQNLSDPAGGNGATTRLTNSSLWGTGPTSADVVQGQLPDCYLLVTCQSLADENPASLKEIAVDLGDGTYAVQFQRDGVTTYVRVDGDLPAGGPYQDGLLYAHPGSSGNQWMAIIEKAYAVFRTGSNSYSSISTGWMSSVFSDLGYNPQAVGTSSASAFYTTVTNALSQNKAVTVGTKTSITGSAPLIANHAYSIIGVSINASGEVMVQLRNPWGFDGAGNDGNASDGKVTVSFSQMVNNSLGVVMA